MNMPHHEVSPIGWPQKLLAERDMAYESIALLYDHKPASSHHEPATRNMGFVISCSKPRFYNQSGCQGCLHKLEAQTQPADSFAQAQLNVTHEAVPGKRSCAQIIPVTPNKLLAACFDEPCVIPIKNFGFKKTFNCDVRAGLATGTHSLTCLATDGQGRQLATGSIDGYVTLFDVRQEELFILNKGPVSDSAVKVVGLEYIRKQQPEEPVTESCHSETTTITNNNNNGPNAIIYATQAGCIGFLDTRVNTGQEINSQLFMRTKPRLNLSSLCVTSSLSQGNSVFFGSSHGHLIGIDLRHSKGYTHELQFPQDQAIGRMRQINFRDPCSGEEKSSLVYTNGSSELQFLDLHTMLKRNDFLCDRNSRGPINDFIKLDDRLITCGDKCSIGCWLMPRNQAPH